MNGENLLEQLADAKEEARVLRVERDLLRDVVTAVLAWDRVTGTFSGVNGHAGDEKTKAVATAIDVLEASYG